MKNLNLNNPKNLEKVNLIFFCTHSLFIASLSLGWKTCLEKYVLVNSHLGNHTNLGKPILDDIIISASSDPVNLENVKKKGKIQKNKYLENERSSLVEMKSIFHDFLNGFFW